MNIVVLLVLAFVAAANSQGCGNPPIQPVWPLSPGSMIVGGSQIEKGSYPWQANLRAPSKSGYYQFCGGTLINDRWVLTAAHCWYRTKDQDIPDYRIGLGYFHQDGTGDENESQLVGISKLFMHEDYNDRTSANDIALLQLDKAVTFNNYVQPACLPTTQVQDACTATPIITGWGDTELTAPDPDYAEYLQQAQVPYIDTATCNQDTWLNGEVLDDMFCAGYAKGGKDTCQGDSGGPLVCTQADGLYYVAGITSWGYGCADVRAPGVYARVAFFRSWIDAIIGSN